MIDSAIRLTVSLMSAASHYPAVLLVLVIVLPLAANALAVTRQALALPHKARRADPGAYRRN